MEVTGKKMTFDQLQRYRLASEVIEYLRDKKPLRILDAGSREGFLRSFLPEDAICNLDIEPFPIDNFIRGDLLRLPFGDGSFDIALALDVLEHVPSPERAGLLTELARVSKDSFIVGAPFRDEQVEEAEKLANEFSRKLTGRENEFLAEHSAVGLPNLDEVVSWAEENRFQTAVLPNGYLPRWLTIFCLNVHLAQIADPWEFIFAVNRFYHEKFYRLDNSSPSYGKIIVFSKTGSLKEEEIRAELTAPDGTAEFPGLPALLAEINRILDFVHQEAVSRLTEENRILRDEKARLQAELQREKDRLQLEIPRLAGELRKTADELNGIKSTRAYKLYKVFVSKGLQKTSDTE